MNSYNFSLIRYICMCIMLHSLDLSEDFKGFGFSIFIGNFTAQETHTQCGLFYFSMCSKWNKKNTWRKALTGRRSNLWTINRYWWVCIYGKLTFGSRSENVKDKVIDSPGLNTELNIKILKIFLYFTTIEC